MKIKKPFCYFIFLLFGLSLTSQELPPVISFTPKEYQADNQNWAISQGDDKRIYVANNKGLLEFNGDTWNLYPSPNESIMRSVFVFEEKIYTGCYREFGFWERDATGNLKYTSLSKSIEKDLAEDEQFWTISNYSNFLLFQSLNAIFIYNTKNGSIQKINSKEGITKMFKVDDDIYVSKPNAGIFKLINGQTQLVTDHPIFKQNLIVNLYKVNDTLLAQTNENGIYSLDETPTPWRPNELEFLKSMSVYNSLQAKSGAIILGTIANGVVFIKPNGTVDFQINKNQSLNNNTVLSLFEDNSNNIWLGLDNGIDCINLNSSIQLFNDDQGSLGTVYTSKVFNDTLYVGTNQGLFYRSLKNSDEATFKLIEASVGQVWELFVYDQTLFCGHHQGTFIVEKTRLKKITNQNGTWCFKPIANTNFILQGHYEGLSILEKQNNQWVFRNKLPNFNLSSKFMEFVDPNTLLISHEYKGIYKLTLNKNYTQITEVQQDNSVEKGLYSSLMKTKNGIYYAYQKGVFKYNEKQRIFEKDTFFSKLYTPSSYTSGRLVVNNQGTSIWNFTNHFINYISESKVTNSKEILSIPIPNNTRNMMLGYENVTPFKDDVFLFGNANGYFLLDLKKFQNRKHNPTIAISKVTAGSMNFFNSDLPLQENPQIENKNNSVNIDFGITQYDKYLAPEYQYFLKGFMDNWSTWQTKSTITFNNLPFGNYEFQVRGRVGEYNYSEVISYNFQIKRPFILSNIMLAVYGLLLILLIFIIHTTYKAYYKKQRQKIEIKNQRELALKQSENKQTLMKLKNEQLQQDIDNKNRELAISTMSLIKKNEFLNSIKSELKQLAKEKNEAKKVITIIDKNLNSSDDWQFFEEAFNNADKDFFKKIKSKHQSLTPDDLRLCAYLRLNLSSKEIAPLFNISPKSVEVKRYRLRKKMDLPNEINLTNYILDI